MRGKESALRRIRWEGSAQLARWMLSAVGGILFSGAPVLGLYTPFACAWTAAVPLRELTGAVAGAVTGTVLFSGGRGIAVQIAAVLIVGAARWILSEWKRLTAHPAFAPVAAAAAVLLTEIWIGRGGKDIPALTVICEALLSGGSAWFLRRSTEAINRPGGFAATDLPTRVACGITGGILLAALLPVTIGPLSVGRTLALGAVLFCAWRGGIIGGCVSGTAVGAMLALSVGSGGWFPMSYAFVGLIAGCFAQLGRFAASVALLVSGGLMVLLLLDAPVGALYELTAASVGFMLIPGRALDWIAAVLFPERRVSPEYLRGSVVTRLDFASRAITHVSQSVEEVSRQLVQRCAPTISAVYEQAIEDTCRDCGMRVFCWQNHYHASMDALNHLSPVLRMHGRISRSDLTEPLASVCKRADRLAETITIHYEDFIHNEAAEQRIAEIRSVVSAQFRGLGDMLREMADSFRKNTVCDEHASREIRKYLESIGLKPIGVVCSGDMHGRMSVEICARRDRSVPMDADALRQAVGRICGRRFGDPGVTHSGGQVRLLLSEQPVYRALTGSAQHICHGAQLCGDHYEFFHDGGGHAVMVLSDGMGSGGRAAVDSAMACGILSRLLLSGLGYDCALRMINSALYVKSGDESLATVDVATIDLVTGHAVFRKAGAAVGFVRNGSRVRQIDLASLPAGILQDIQFARAETELEEDAWVLLLSDGALASGSDWISVKLQEWNDTPQKLCEELVRLAADRRSDGHDDDITVAAIQLKTQ